MEPIVEEVVSEEDLKKFEKIYNGQAERGPVSPKAQFEYAWCLVRSKYKSDMQRGIALLEDLYHKTADDGAKRDYLFYMAVAHTRLKEYEKALKFTNAILQVEPRNHQAHNLKQYIEHKMKKEGIIGMAIIGGAAAVGLAGLIGLGFAVAKNK